MTAEIWPVVDLFSGAGGMSCGFARRSPFRVIGAVDAEQAKPSGGFGKLDCNETYEANIGVRPLAADIASLDPAQLLPLLSTQQGHPLGRGELTVLICCTPCTDFSRAKPTNHLVDSPKNSLVVRSAEFVEAALPEYVVMENARELIAGRNDHHYRAFAERLGALGYSVKGEVQLLTKFGLPQVRERALVIAARDTEAKTLTDLWKGWRPAPAAVTVRHAIGALGAKRLMAGRADPDDPMHCSPGFSSDLVRQRMKAIPRDGGSWFDLADHPEKDTLLVKSMRDRLAKNDLGSHPDVYGRLAWDKPAVTIKRECAHVGNGRYAHPTQARLLSVREMALLQGFPKDYVFTSRSLANRYRHIGDAVPPLIAYQISALVTWMKTGLRPQPRDWVLAGTTLKLRDIRAVAVPTRGETELVQPAPA